MMKFLSKFSDRAYALLRIVAGLMFAFHGAQKLFGVLGGQQVSLVSQMGLAGLIELFGGLAVALGFGTRVAAFVASGEMAVAYFQVHWKLQMSSQFFPIVNHGELALLYSFLFLFIATRGTVRWGLDKKA
jgi:putative oxidoreductase